MPPAHPPTPPRQVGRRLPVRLHQAGQQLRQLVSPGRRQRLPPFVMGSECPLAGTVLDAACTQADPGLATTDVLTLHNACPTCSSEPY